MNLVQFKKSDLETTGAAVTYHLKFDNGFESLITSKYLRDNCPCAICSGEEVLLHKFVPDKSIPVSEKGYLLSGAENVGNYAIKLSWHDGHNSGIYTWEYLQKLCKNFSNERGVNA